MREGWRKTTIGEVCELVNGGTPETKVKKYWDGCHAWITPAEMGGLPSPYVDRTRRTLTDAGLAACSARLLPQNSVVISSRAPIGHLIINQLPMATNQGCKGLIPKNSLHTKFLYYYLLSIVDHLEELGSGTTFKELSATKLKAVSITVPPTPKQRSIVAILDEAFEGIGRAIANAEKNLLNARALLDSYRDAAFASEGGDYIETTLGHEIELLTGHPFKSKEYVDPPHGIRLLRGDNILQGYFRWDGVKHWPDEKTAEFQKYLLLEDDIVLAMDRTWVKAGLKHAKISRADLPCLLVQRVARLRAKSDLNPDYLHFLIGSKAFTNYVLSIQTGTGVPHISGRQIQSFRFQKPPLRKQKELAETLTRLLDRTTRLSKNYAEKVRSLEQLKQSLLQKAFSGELAAKSVLVSAAASADQNELDTKSPEFAANVIALIYDLHARHRRERTFGHVKAQKALHMIESLGGLDLGRQPIKDAAGPNDFRHMLAAEEWAKAELFFEFVPRGDGYDFKKLPRYQQMLSKAQVAAKPHCQELERVATILVPMNSREAEIFATVHAAWNNLIRDNASTDDGSIIWEARENWHPSKKRIPEAEFRKAIRSIRSKGLAPDGTAKHVGGQGSLF